MRRSFCRLAILLAIFTMSLVFAPFGVPARAQDFEPVDEVLNDLKKMGIEKYLAERPDVPTTLAWIANTINKNNRVRWTTNKECTRGPLPQLYIEYYAKASGAVLRLRKRRAHCSRYCSSHCTETFETVLDVRKLTVVKVATHNPGYASDSIGVYSELVVFTEKDGIVRTLLATDSRLPMYKDRLGHAYGESRLEVKLNGAQHEIYARKLGKAFAHLILLKVLKEKQSGASNPHDKDLF